MGSTNRWTDTDGLTEREPWTHRQQGYLISLKNYGKHKQMDKHRRAHGKRTMDTQAARLSHKSPSFFQNKRSRLINKKEDKIKNIKDKM
jgi:hypothetical protein